MNYYSKRLLLPRVDEKDNIIGKVERWKAHEEGILHRGFTVALFYGDRLVCQHRKHPVFDGYLDLTSSSHPIYIDGKLQSVEDAVYFTLKREWGVERKNIKQLGEKGKVYYKTRDGKYTEHEVCYLYLAKIKNLPKVNFNYSYGFSLLTKSQIKSSNFPLKKSLAPWVLEFLKEKLI